MTFPSNLAYFCRAEFHHPDAMDSEFLYFLESVRSRYGAPLTVTSDARSVAEESQLPNHANPPENSLHVQGRAVDLRWIADRVARYAFNRAVVLAGEALGVAPELEYVPAGEPHIHLGLFHRTHSPTLIFG